MNAPLVRNTITFPAPARDVDNNKQPSNTHVDPGRDVDINTQPSNTRIDLGVVAPDLDPVTPAQRIVAPSDEAAELDLLHNDPAEQFLQKLAQFFQLDKDKIMRQRKSRQRESSDLPQHRPEQFGGDPLRKLIVMIVENVYGSLLAAVDNLRSQGEGRFDFPPRMDGSSVLRLIIQQQRAQALLLDNFLHYAADLHYRRYKFKVSRHDMFDKNYERANAEVGMSFRALKNNWRWDTHRQAFVYEGS